MDDMQTDLMAIMNLQHEYSHITQAGAIQSGYKSADEMLGTTIFDLKTPAAKIANLSNRSVKTIEGHIEKIKKN